MAVDALEVEMGQGKGRFSVAGFVGRGVVEFGGQDRQSLAVGFPDAGSSACRCDRHSARGGQVTSGANADTAAASARQ